MHVLTLHCHLLPQTHICDHSAALIEALAFLVTEASAIPMCQRYKQAGEEAGGKG